MIRVLLFALVLSLAPWLSGCTSAPPAPAADPPPAAGSSSNVTLTDLSIKVSMSPYTHSVNVTLTAIAVGDGPVEIRLPASTADIANPTGARRVVTNEHMMALGSIINTSYDGDDIVHQVIGGFEIPGTPERRVSFFWTMKGLLQQLPDGSWALEWDVLSGMSGMNIRSATVILIGSGAGSKESAPAGAVCLLDSITLCQMNSEAPAHVTIKEYETLWASFTANDLTLDGSNYHDRIHLSLRWPEGAFRSIKTPPEIDQWKVLAGAAAVIILTVLTIIVTWYVLLIKNGLTWRAIRNSFAVLRQPWKTGTHTKGFRFSDANVSAAVELGKLAGYLMLIGIISGGVMALGSFFPSVWVYGRDAADIGIFELLAYGGLLGGIVAPFLLFFVPGLFLGTWYGGQSVNKYGFLVSIPFAVWFFAGLIVCDMGLGAVLAPLLQNAGIDVSLEPLLPWWVYWAVIIPLNAGLFLMSARRGVLPKRKTPELLSELNASKKYALKKKSYAKKSVPIKKTYSKNSAFKKKTYSRKSAPIKKFHSKKSTFKKKP